MLKRPAPPVTVKVNYLNLTEVAEVANKHPTWVVLKNLPDLLILGFYNEVTGNIEKKVSVSSELVATATFGDVPLKNSWNLEVDTVSSILKLMDSMCICMGAQLKRSKNCAGAVASGRCSPCQTLLIQVETKLKQITHPMTPLSKMSRDDLILQIRTERSQLKALKTSVIKMQREVAVGGICLSESLSEGLFTALSCHEFKNNTLMKLFWTEQERAFHHDPRGMKWHPMIVRFAIYLHYQSPRCYEALRQSGVLQLPNKSTLRDYTNVIQPKPGFQLAVFQELKEQSASLRPEQRYVALLHDEMSVRSDLVYDRRSGEVIGFTNPDGWTFEDQDMTEKIASQVLVFMVVGFNNHIKKSIAHFGTQASTAGELFPLLWTAIGYLEMACQLKVITSTSDKASPNQRLYRLHRIGNEDVVFKAKNPYASDGRCVYFLSDAPHLIKTIRNNVNKSRPGGTRCLWNNEQHILWAHVFKVYNEDINRQLYRTKLTHDHVALTPTSTMSVRLAAQVLSRSVSVVMEHYYTPEMTETARFFMLCDRFFDCLNGRSLKEGVFKRKPDLAPYQNLDDVRFQFLHVEFLGYLKRWKDTTDNRPGFTKKEKSKMFLSHQTYEGIVMTVHAFVEATQFLLRNGVSYVLSQTFCQDPLEEHFGRHRGLAGRADNPTLSQFSYQENQLRLQRDLAFTFNPKGKRNGEREETLISSSPLKKIKRH